jgi:tRNA pseudouridine38-40 synthase
MKQHFQLTIEYDGSLFYGWQRQQDRPTVQEEIETQLSRILNQKITIAGSGRTDAGVHAYGQTASFAADTRLSPQRIKKGLNSLIKQPVVIHDCSVVSQDFHAQYSAISKEYHYHILNREDPCAIKKGYVWHVRQQLDLNAMNACCKSLVGTHDFKSFENTGSPRSSTVRTVFFSRMERVRNDSLVFKICATGFLKYMVRNIVGTLVAAGRHNISPEKFDRILAAKDRTKAGATAPAHGLFLMRVNYS